MEIPKAPLEVPNREAEHWFSRLLSPDCTAAERRAFERWRDSDLKNQAAYADIERIYQRSAELAEDPEVQAAARAALRQQQRPRAWLWWSTRLGAPLVACSALFWLSPPRASLPMEHVHYATVVGERRTVQLTDGSGVILDTASSLDVQISARARTVQLTEGRAQFDVVHDARRPFTVEVGAGVIRDVGTTFQVSLQTRSVDVAVLQGRVAVESHWSKHQPSRQDELGAGQRLEFDESGELWSIQPANPQTLMGWTTGDLSFDDTPLQSILDEMNRYTTAKVRLGDAVLRNLRVSGVFHAGDQQSFLMALERGWSLHSAQDAGGDFVLSAH